MVRITIGLLLVAVLVGCGSKRSKYGVITGTIKYKGQPLSGAALLLYPNNDPTANPLNIPVGQDGAFRIEDVAAGQYKMSVQGTAGAVQADMRNIPPEKQAEVREKLAHMNTAATPPFPNKYKDPKTSGLELTITDKSEKMNLDLTD
jgi:hypothetical protein